MAGPTDYSLFGLRVRSEVELPELFLAIGAGQPDVTIQLGVIEERAPPGRVVQPIEGGLLFAIKDAGRYRVRGGRDIMVEPAAGVPERNVRLYLLGSVFGALLHQRGLLPLHANAVQLGDKAVGFMGESGSGKSTLAAWFHDRGYPIMADDVCVVRFDVLGRAFAVPGLPRLRLWQEALEATGRDAGDFGRSYVGEETWDKFDVPVDLATAATHERGLAAVYVLEKGDELEIRQLEGVEAAEAVFAHTYRGTYVTVMNGQHEHWSAAMRMVRSTPVFRLTRRWGLGQMVQDGMRILDHASGIGLPDQAIAG